MDTEELREEMSARNNAMSTRSRAIVAGWAAVFLWIPVAIAADAAATAATNASGAVPDDASMTCEQIATELAPYGQQMLPNLQALGASTQQLYEQGRVLAEQRRTENAALNALATAGALDPTGMAKRAHLAAMIAQQAKEQRENEAIINSPLAQQQRAQTDRFIAQNQRMQSDVRLQRLLQLAQQKQCARN